MHQLLHMHFFSISLFIKASILTFISKCIHLVYEIFSTCIHLLKMHLLIKSAFIFASLFNHSVVHSDWNFSFFFCRLSDGRSDSTGSKKETTLWRKQKQVLQIWRRQLRNKTKDEKKERESETVKIKILLWSCTEKKLLRIRIFVEF